jgi:hypothetical protein
MKGTFFHMWASTKEATPTVRAHPSCFDRADTTKSTISQSCVLIHQVGVLCPSAFAKIFYLHDLWEERDIHRRSRGLCEVMSLENILVLQQYDEVVHVNSQG